MCVIQVDISTMLDEGVKTAPNQGMHMNRIKLKTMNMNMKNSLLL